MYVVSGFSRTGKVRLKADTTTVSSGSRRWELASDLGDRFRVEHEIVLFEQACDAGFVDLHLQLADGHGPERRDAFSLHAVVADLDPFHTEWRDGIDVRGCAQPGASGPGIPRNETDAGRAGGSARACAGAGPCCSA